MQLYRLACLIAIELKPQITNARILKLKSDKYGSAFPCRKCHKKYDYAIFAEMCCKKEYSKEKRDQYINSIPVGSPGLRKHVCALLDLLWRFGYDTPICLEDLLNWSGWENITKKAAGGFADDLLGYIFKSKPETVRRKLARGILKNEYEDHEIPLWLQDFKNRKIFGRFAVLRPSHWYRHEAADSNAPASLNGKRININIWRISNSIRYELARYLIPESEKSSDA